MDKFLQTSAVAGVYFLAGRLGLELAFLHASATAVWPGTAFAFFIFLLLGYRAWPGIFLGSFLVNITTTGSIPMCLGIAAGNTLEGIAAAYFVLRWARGLHVFERAQDIFKFTGIIAFLAAPISATIGVVCLCLGGTAAWTHFGSLWLTWWLGNTIGAILIAPILVLWYLNPRWKSSLQLVEFGLVLAVIVAIGGMVFGPWARLQTYPLEFLCVPPIIWAAYRLGRRETVTAMLVLATIAVWGTSRGMGPFAGKSINESLLLLQSFMGVLSITGLTLSAVVLERSLAESLQQAESRYRTLVEAAPDIIFMLSAEGRVLALNPAFESICGRKISDWLGKDFLPLIHPEDQLRVMEYFTRVLQGESLKVVEVRGLKESGQEIILEVTARPQIESGRIASILGVARDVTERRRDEVVLREKQQELAHATVEREQMELFTSVAAHDLQEPLKKIIAFGDLLKEECLDRINPSGLDYLKRMQNAAKRMQGLIGDLLKFSRVVIHKNSPDIVKCAQVIDEVLADLELPIRSSGARIEVATLPVLYANPVQVREIFHNLISNALKFKKPDQNLVVRIEGRDLDNNMAEIKVRDNGVGFDNRYAERIFKPFERLNRNEYEGNGIGLAICQKIVARLGGRISAEGILGEGAVFVVVLPRVVASTGGALVAADEVHQHSHR